MSEWKKHVPDPVAIRAINRAGRIADLKVQAKPGITEQRAKVIRFREYGRALLDIGTKSIVDRIVCGRNKETR